MIDAAAGEFGAGRGMNRFLSRGRGRLRRMKANGNLAKGSPLPNVGLLPSPSTCCRELPVPGVPEKMILY